jgi:hypothetical protein
MAEAINPGRGPLQLIPGESRRMNFNDDIAVVRALETGEPRRVRLGPLHQRHPRRSRGPVRHHDRFRLATSLSNSPRPRYDVTGVSVVSASLWANPDDRLALGPFGRVEGGDGIVEGRDVSDVRPQPTIPDSLDDSNHV